MLSKITGIIGKTALLLIFAIFFAAGIFSAESPEKAKKVASGITAEGEGGSAPAEIKGFWMTSRSVKPEVKSSEEENALRWRNTSLWTLSGLEDMGVSSGIWKLKATRGNPQMFSPITKIDAENQPIVAFRMRLGKGLASKGCILFTTEDLKDFSDDSLVLFFCASDGEFHDYEVDMSKNPLWKGRVRQIRLQPFYVADKNLTEETSFIEIESFQFLDLR